MKSEELETKGLNKRKSKKKKNDDRKDENMERFNYCSLDSTQVTLCEKFLRNLK